jgi:hypothetical protein
MLQFVLLAETMPTGYYSLLPLPLRHPYLLLLLLPTTILIINPAATPIATPTPTPAPTTIPIAISYCCSYYYLCSPH